jgi:tripartite-type tricarboxylate transporter receptor subunit TctC
MSVTRRSALTSAACAIAGAMLPPCALAQPWPQRPLRIVVGFQAGGTGDVVARLVGERLAPLLGTSIVIENKPGGSGVTAANSVRMIDDDHTLLMVSETYVVTPLINRNAGFDSRRDFKHVGIVAEGPHLVLAAKDAPFKTFEEFAKHARSTSSGVDYATSGFGHPQHLIGEYLAAKLSARLVHLPTRGGSAAVNEVLAGTLKLAILGLGPTFQLIQDGRLVPLAVSTAQRVPALPDVPTLMELGFKDFSAPQWLGLVAPQILSDQRVSIVSQQLAKALVDATMRQKLDALGFAPLFLDASAMAARISQEEARWRAILAAANLAPK